MPMESLTTGTALKSIVWLHLGHRDTRPMSCFRTKPHEDEHGPETTFKKTGDDM